MTPAGIVTPPAPIIGVVSVDTNRSPTALNLGQTATCGLSTITVPADTCPAATPGTAAVSLAGATGAVALAEGTEESRAGAARASCAGPSSGGSDVAGRGLLRDRGRGKGTSRSSGRGRSGRLAISRSRNKAESEAESPLLSPFASVSRGALVQSEQSSSPTASRHTRLRVRVASAMQAKSSPSRRRPVTGRGQR